jgi:predicted HicB family RNase H-like nuclease
MEHSERTVARQRGQGFRATRRLTDLPLERNMVVRCSDQLYQAARSAAGERSVSLSDYVRELIIQDVQRSHRSGMVG